MAKDIQLMGAVFPDVPKILLPQYGTGNLVSFTDVTGTTATAADVASGKVFYASDGTETTGTASGGGGSTNIIQGTFKHEEDMSGGTYAWMDVDVPYNGDGYPITLQIFPAEGGFSYDNDGYYGLMDRYAITSYLGVKAQFSVEPNYTGTGNADKIYAIAGLKSSSTNATAATPQVQNNYLGYTNSTVTPSASVQDVRIRSKNRFSVRVGKNSGSDSNAWHFANQIEYTYIMTYSE